MPSAQDIFHGGRRHGNLARLLAVLQKTCDNSTAWEDRTEGAHCIFEAPRAAQAPVALRLLSRGCRARANLNTVPRYAKTFPNRKARSFPQPSVQSARKQSRERKDACAEPSALLSPWSAGCNQDHSQLAELALRRVSRARRAKVVGSSCSCPHATRHPAARIRRDWSEQRSRIGSWTDIVRSARPARKVQWVAGRAKGIF